MIELWLVIIVLTFMAMAILCWPLLQAKTNTAVEINRKQENISIFQQRLAELEQELQQVVINAESFSELKLELEKNLLTDAADLPAKVAAGFSISRGQTFTVLAVAIALPIISLGFYSKFGSSEELSLVLNSPQQIQNELGKPTAVQAIALLEAELERAPDNPEGWYMLAGAYMSSNQFDKGAAAFAQVLLYLPEQAEQFPSVIGQYAQALFFIDNKVTARVKNQINRALNLDNQEVVSLGLLGIDAFEQQQYQMAIDYWNQSLLNAEPNAAEALKSGIAKARERLAAGDQQVTAAVNKLKVVVDVDIAAELKSQLADDAVLFVFARPVGGRIPLAAVKMTVAELPKRVVLDDSLAMMANSKISLQKKVEVSARISLSGRPISEKGDFESTLLVLEVREVADPVKLLIDKVVE
ncbi:MAG: c-type cytochrome biogenesis protein CcmI [Pseudomonadales bacterium]|nr:c-type cytochrome biogenesis protein CcmI [Pseudomonadales bacterium]